ncbi:Uncharacterised protein [Vibrio cholerae]|nr:Uncharacterised protein [Vibrio cholerae]
MSKGLAAVDIGQFICAFTPLPTLSQVLVTGLQCV